MNQEIKKALEDVFKSLTKRQKEKLSKQTEILKDFITHKMPGSFWLDTKKKEQARKNMKLAWGKRNHPIYKLTYRSTGIEKEVSLKELSKLTGLKKHSIQCYLSKGKTYFTVDDDVVQIERFKEVK